MTDSPNLLGDGGPAFPSARDMRHNPDFDHEGGMTLRDYFAIRALPLVAVGHCDAHAAAVWVHAEHFDGLAADAYALADAMLKARQR